MWKQSFAFAVYATVFFFFLFFFFSFRASLCCCSDNANTLRTNPNLKKNIQIVVLLGGVFVRSFVLGLCCSFGWLVFEMRSVEPDLLGILRGKLPHDVWCRIVDRVKVKKNVAKRRCLNVM
jgi:hypothetical protein